MAIRMREERLELEFEQKATKLIKVEEWQQLDSLAGEHLEATSGKSFKGFFYMGVAMYKMGDYENCIRALSKAQFINEEDA
jgi:hypothetical protein